MTHIKEEEISAYLDEQLSSEEKLVLEAHLRDCEHCRAVRDELSEVTRLFREAERFEPSPFLWSRIEADYNKESSSERHHWLASFIAGLSISNWSFRLASAALVVLAAAGIFVFHGNTNRMAERAALADIDRTHQSLAALDPDTYNPFGSGLPSGLDANPFRSMRLSSEKSGIGRQSREID
ncbi:MAG: zf-HC2 domain-containing protein [Acidobacteria bacterium]|nr:zf-HC2 domain-containing protein [Acidobacteriota bacterium]